MAPVPTPLERAKKIAGGTAALARRLGIKTQAISQWEEVPIKRVPAVASITGMDCHELRPDFFPAPKRARAA